MPRIDIKNKSFIDFIGEGITTSNAGALAIVKISGGTFLKLLDTPDSYVGQNNKFIRVKSDATGLEFIDFPAGDNLGNHIATQDLDMASFAITSVGTVDGRDVSVDGSSLDNHLDGTANKHDASEVDVEGAYASISTTDLETAIGEIDTFISAGASHRDGGVSKHDGTEIDFELVDGSKKVIQAGSDDVENALIDLDSSLGDHLDGTANKHDASEVDVEGTYASISTTDLETAIGEIDTFISAGASHRDGGVSKHDGTEIDFELVDGSKKVIQAGSDDVENALIDLDSSLGDHLDGTANKHDASEVDVEGTYANIVGTPTDLESTMSAVDTALGDAGVDNFKALTDTPANFTDDAGKILRVNDAEDALEFVLQPNGALGGYQEEISFSGYADTTISGTWVDIAGISDQTFVTPVSGKHSLDAYFSWYTTGGTGGGSTTHMRLRALIDDSIWADLGQFTAENRANGGGTGAYRQHINNTAIATLSAGSHTIRFQWFRSFGDATLGVSTSDASSILIQAMGSGINGLEVIEDKLISEVLLPGSGLSDIGLEVVVSTLEGERVKLDFCGIYGRTDCSGLLRAGWLFDIDAGSITSDTHSERWWPEENPSSSDYTWKSINISWTTPALSAGQHTIKLKGGDYTGAIPIRIQANAYLQATRYKSFGIGAGTIVTEDTLGIDFVQVADDTWEDTGLSITVNTIASERIDLKAGSTIVSSTNVLQALVRFSIDGGAITSPPWYDNGNDHQSRIMLTPNWVTPVLSAGSHTITFQTRRSAASGNLTLTANASYGPTFLQAIQYRGGLIPILDEGISVVDKPSAIDFAGAGVTVTQSGTKALVTIPGTGNAIEVQDEGISLTAGVTKFNFTGAGVTATEPVADEILVTIPGGGGNAIEVQDEGISLTAGVTKFNFTGAGVTATEPVADEILVTIPGTGNAIEVQDEGISLTAGVTKFNFVGAGVTVTEPVADEMLVTIPNGEIGAGAIITEDTLAGDWTQAAVSAWGDSGLEILINTIANEQVELLVHAQIFANVNGSIGNQTRFLIDGAISSPQCYAYMEGTGAAKQRSPINFKWITPALTAGPHTIKVQGYRNGVAHCWKAGGVLQATQHRGGLTHYTVFTPTGSWTINTTYTGMYRVVGDVLECRVKVVLSGAPNAVTLTVDLPSGYTIDTAKLLTPTLGSTPLGTCVAMDTGTAAQGGQVMYYDTNTVRPMVVSTGAAYARTAIINNTTPHTFANTDHVSLIFSVPIT